MAYRALEKMREKNYLKYGISNTVKIPTLPKHLSKYGLEAMKFLRDDCEDLLFRSKEPEMDEYGNPLIKSDDLDLDDSDGRSKKCGQIPYNMERDLDRLCFERAIGRFLKTGSREDAFDIYYCYCEIFHPFGGGFEETGILLQLLSEHEYNASSLLMKHRDHYSHSVYVFCIGLSIYKNHQSFREAYHKRFNLSDGPKAACHFLEWWGLTSLFHDIGYPFEIAHQQMYAYADKLSVCLSHTNKTMPYISYRDTDKFYSTNLGNPNDFYSNVIVNCMSKYLERINHEPNDCQKKLLAELTDRAVHDHAKKSDCYRMDHAYFSGLTLAKAYIDCHQGINNSQEISQPVLDSFCAIILHNSLFKYTVRDFLNTTEPLRLSDEQPLAYLLMLCDELQCWDRTCYGEKTRQKVYAFDFDMSFPDGRTIALEYSFDQNSIKTALDKSAYDEMRSGKFLNDINAIISLGDIIPGFTKDSLSVADNKTHKSEKGLYLSDSSYLNLYLFAKALHVFYRAKNKTRKQAETEFQTELSLEYKLSNIAQAKGYAAILEQAHCFYTDRPVDYEPVTDFTEEELAIMSNEEQIRWDAEKTDMGWQFGNTHCGQTDPATARECLRTHDAMGPYEDLTPENKEKIREALIKMPKVLLEYDGLTIYRR